VAVGPVDLRYRHALPSRTTQEVPVDKVVHFEIPFDNKERAMTFYSRCFGWQLQDMPQLSYVMAKSVATGPDYRPVEPGAINGGLFQRPAEAPSPVLYIGVVSVDEALAKVTAAGGRVVTPKTPIPGMGAYARIADTEGNVVGLFEGSQQ
jgi:predicted enzyme related to lactoylglutathione lyase